MDSIDADKFWKSILLPLEGEVQDQKFLEGISGERHPVLAFSEDSKRKRIVAISLDFDVRIARTVQSDIQAKYSDYHVIFARPVFFETQLLVANLTSRIKKQEFTLNEIEQWMNGLGGPESDSLKARMTTEMKDFFATAPFPRKATYTQFPFLFLQYLMAAFASFRRSDFWAFLESDPPPDKLISTSDFLLEAENLSDANRGICPIPMYQMTDADLGLFQRCDRDEIQERMSEWGLFQYFFPPRDQLALALIERGIVQSRELEYYINDAPKIGHPFGKQEILTSENSTVETIEELEAMGLTTRVEREILQLTNEGHEVRTKIYGQPRESFTSKLLKIVKLEISTKGWFSINVNSDDEAA
ncbi:MAG: hypothetical protein AAFX54_12550 [Pseudomonadota bacterium]